MTTKIKKLICVAVVLIVCVGTLCACNDDPDVLQGEFYTLQKAYDNGCLSKDDLSNIAYHYSGDSQGEEFEPTPKDPEELSKETEFAIRTCWAERHKDDEFAGRINKLKYCGTYGGFTSVYIYSGALAPQAVLVEIIGEIKFVYPNSAHQIYVWKVTE